MLYCNQQHYHASNLQYNIYVSIYLIYILYMCAYMYIYTHTHTQSVKSLDTPPHLKCFFFIFMTIYIIDCRYEWTHMEDRFFIIATLWFEYCFAHWHSLCELHEVVTWNGFLFTGVPCRIYICIYWYCFSLPYLCFYFPHLFLWFREVAVIV